MEIYIHPNAEHLVQLEPEKNYFARHKSKAKMQPRTHKNNQNSICEKNRQNRQKALVHTVQNLSKERCPQAPVQDYHMLFKTPKKMLDSKMNSNARKPKLELAPQVSDFQKVKCFATPNDKNINITAEKYLLTINTKKPRPLPQNKQTQISAFHKKANYVAKNADRHLEPNAKKSPGLSCQKNAHTPANGKDILFARFWFNKNWRSRVPKTKITQRLSTPRASS